MLCKCLNFCTPVRTSFSAIFIWLFGRELTRKYQVTSLTINGNRLIGIFRDWLIVTSSFYYHFNTLLRHAVSCDIEIYCDEDFIDNSVRYDIY